MKNIKISGPAEYVMLITLNRPKALNALSKSLLTEVASALEEANSDDTVRCVVITGDERAFSSGADIKEMPEDGIPMWAAADRLKAWKYIEAEPLEYVTLTIRKAYQFWHGDEVGRNQAIYYWRNYSNVLSVTGA